MSKLTLEQAVAQADLLVDRPTIDKAIAQIADAIARDYKGEIPVFVSIMNGYLQASRYHGETGGQLVWKHRPVSSLYGRRVILVDDILDEGFTLQGVRQWCLEQGATDVRIAVLTVKQHERCLGDVKADYAGVQLPDRFVFGFGMDIDESLRTLPAIYAMKQA